MNDQVETRVDQLIRTVNFNLTKKEWEIFFIPGTHKLESNYTNVFYQKPQLSSVLSRNQNCFEQRLLKNFRIFQIHCQNLFLTNYKKTYGQN